MKYEHWTHQLFWHSSHYWSEKGIICTNAYMQIKGLSQAFYFWNNETVKNCAVRCAFQRKDKAPAVYGIKFFSLSYAKCGEKKSVSIGME